ncbi:MAG: hypothetical protein M1826_003272 [Phylliscum demangeonii]|nr:MAG: hypothetical protein M1826_003272 [Phylliscum demangeonii]
MAAETGEANLFPMEQTFEQRHARNETAYAETESDCLFCEIQEMGAEEALVTLQREHQTQRKRLQNAP